MVEIRVPGRQVRLHNNKQQSLKLEQSLTEAHKNNLIIGSHLLSRRTFNRHYKLWYLFLYFGILHSKYVILLGLCLVFVDLFLPIFLSGYKIKYSINMEDYFYTF